MTAFSFASIRRPQKRRLSTARNTYQKVRRGPRRHLDFCALPIVNPHTYLTRFVSEPVLCRQGICFRHRLLLVTRTRPDQHEQSTALRAILLMTFSHTAVPKNAPAIPPAQGVSPSKIDTVTSRAFYCWIGICFITMRLATVAFVVFRSVCKCVQCGLLTQLLLFLLSVHDVKHNSVVRHSPLLELDSDGYGFPALLDLQSCFSVTLNRRAFASTGMQCGDSWTPLISRYVRPMFT